MRKLLVFTLLIIGLITQSEAQTDTFLVARKLGKQAAEYLKSNDFENIHQRFSEEMVAALPLERMKKSFSGLAIQFGAINEILEFNARETAEAVYFYQAAKFEKETLDLVFTLNDKEKFTSFSLRPHQQTYEWLTREYAKGPNDYEEEFIAIGDSLPLTGKITIPDNGMETVVVFVHGSGPNDMNETLGPNKLFKDLAYGLASNGIASIRYNKRTCDYPSAMAKQANSLTIQQVVVKDAVNAIKLARENGAKKIVLLGHSLGGYCTPMIAQLAQPDAVIVLAGNVSPIEDLLVPQFEHIKENDTSIKINDFRMAMIRMQVERVQKGDYGATTAPPLLPLSLPASFWLSLKDYNPQKVAKKQSFPYLILNGERDYQVTPKEAKKWKGGSKNKHSKTIIYPKLNHMFFEGEGICVPAEYEKEGHFSEIVLKDIINWISEI
ncbi:alpha/beta fold hydrolase [Vicingaceae bacterium]|nr:alpha/beta fold hydrolase [Vicingaceae bacterium]